MDILKKAMDLGRQATGQASQAMASVREGGAKVKKTISDTVGAHVSAGGFGVVAKRALDKSTEVMLDASVKLLDSVVRNLAAGPDFSRVVDARHLEHLKSEVEKRGRKWEEHSEADLVQLRAVFSNSGETLALGAAINAYLGRASANRVEAVRCALETSAGGARMVDPQALAVLKLTQAEGKKIEDMDAGELRMFITRVVDSDQHYYNQVYNGLTLAMRGDSNAVQVLATVEDRPHYLVHHQLAMARRVNSHEECIRNIEVARFCRPGDPILYDVEYREGEGASAIVLEECRAVLSVRRDRQVGRTESRES